MLDLLADLNSEQRHVVTYSGGPLLVLAGPGSGKTRVVTRRIAYRVAQGGLAPRRIAAITFTNRAALEMKERLRELLGDEEQPVVGTFHWLCNVLLRRCADRIGWRRDFRLLTPRESRQSLRRVAELSHVSGRQMTEYATVISGEKNGADLRTLAQERALDPAVVQRIATLYAAHLKRLNALDLDDLLVFAVRALQSDQRARDACRTRFQELIVDEYQDTNPRQQQLLELLCPHSESIVAVGDEDQAIYGWRQAGTGGVEAFQRMFPACETVTLGLSYRHSKLILRSAAALIARNQARTPKTLRTDNPAGAKPMCLVADDEQEEAEWVAEEIERLVTVEHVPHGEITVLYRVNVQARALEDAFVRRGVPYRVRSGSGFYQRAEIRRVAAYLRLALDKGDQEAAAYLLGGVAGIGPRRLKYARAAASERGMFLLEVGADENSPAKLPQSARRACRDLLLQVAALQPSRSGPVSGLVDQAAEFVAADTDLMAQGIDQVKEHIEELRSISREYGARRGTLRGFVDRITLHDENALVHDRVNLLTLHAAKGLEFAAVFLVGLEEGLLPHRRALEQESEIEEERRLCYVGLTRASQYLYLSYAHARFVAGQSTVGRVSRFVGEIGSINLDLRLSKRTAGNPRLRAASPGERVKHPRWDLGTVLAVEGKGRNTLVTIMFDSAGKQRLQLCHTPLVRVPPSREDVLAG